MLIKIIYEFYIFMPKKTKARKFCDVHIKGFYK